MIIKKLPLAFFMSVLVYTSYAQPLLTDTTTTKFYPANEEPSAQWKNIDFDDSDWSQVQGEAIFGYGDSCTVETERVPSVYIRSFFDVEAVANHTELIFYCDFDDGFVAYIVKP